MSNKKIIGGVITEISYTIIFLLVLFSINMVLTK